MRVRTRVCWSLVSLWLATTCATVRAATIQAVSCSRDDLQAAVDSAADNDTVVVPAGRCRWTSAVTVTGKAVTIQGAGIDETIITDGTSDDWGQTALWVEGREDKPYRITGFTFNGAGDWSGILHLSGNGRNFRVDNCKFEEIDYPAIVIGDSYGVIDHCVFNADHTHNFLGVQIQPGTAEADLLWQQPLTLGTENAVYVEDCLFLYSAPDNSHATAIDAHNGARYVFRYNMLLGSDQGYPSICAHGACTSYRSTFSYEIYANTFFSAQEWAARAVFLRGGTGVIFNNSFWNYNSAIDLVDYKPCQHVHGICGEWDRCTTYPCQDQIGRSTDSGPGTAQALEPVYEWGNTLGVFNANIGVTEWDDCDPNVSFFVQENRDYHTDTERPGYSPYVYPHPLNDGVPTCQNQGHRCCEQCAAATEQPQYDTDCGTRTCCAACEGEDAGAGKGCGCQAGAGTPGAASLLLLAVLLAGAALLASRRSRSR